MGSSASDGPRQRQGQAALEYMVMISVALFITAPLVMQVQESSFELRNSFDNGLVRNTLNNVEEAASLVNSQGEPARVTFRVRLPDRITRTNVTENYIVIERRMPNGRSAEFYSVFDFNVTGTMPNQSGIHTLAAEAEDDHVNITVQ